MGESECGWWIPNQMKIFAHLQLPPVIVFTSQDTSFQQLLHGYCLHITFHFGSPSPLRWLLPINSQWFYMFSYITWFFLVLWIFYFSFIYYEFSITFSHHCYILPVAYVAFMLFNILQSIFISSSAVIAFYFPKVIKDGKIRKKRTKKNKNLYKLHINIEMKVLNFQLMLLGWFRLREYTMLPYDRRWVLCIQ